MRCFTLTAPVVMGVVLVLGSIPAQAEMNGGGPLRKGNQCFHYSTRADQTYGRFGYWGDCPQTASTTTATTVSTTRPRRVQTTTAPATR